jgi:hypothetical protein
MMPLPYGRQDMLLLMVMLSSVDRRFSAPCLGLSSLSRGNSFCRVSTLIFFISFHSRTVIALDIHLIHAGTIVCLFIGALLC